MGTEVKLAFRLFRRGRKYYAQNNETGQQERLHTADKKEAERQLNAKNKACRMGGSNLQIARAYMAAVDPPMPAPGNHDPLFGLSRSFLNHLILPRDDNGHEKMCRGM